VKLADSRTRRIIFVAAVAAIGLMLASCAAVLNSIEDRLPPPHEVDGGILFRHNAPSARQVNLAGEFNNWAGTSTGRYDPEIGLMSDEDGDGVWSIVEPLPPGRYQYKFVIDAGVRWEEDLNNPDTTDDGYGGYNSQLVVPPTVGYRYEVFTGTLSEGETATRITAETQAAKPTIAGTGDLKEVTFEYDDPNAGEVSVAGEFNGWDPAAHPLEKGGDGVWRATLEIEPGTYEYKFVVDGTWVEDPANPETVSDPYGGKNSVLMVE